MLVRDKPTKMRKLIVQCNNQFRTNQLTRHADPHELHLPISSNCESAQVNVWKKHNSYFKIHSPVWPKEKLPCSCLIFRIFN